MSYTKHVKISKEILFQCLKNHTNSQVANHFGVGTKTIQRWRNEYGLSAEKVKYGHYPELTEQQRNFLVASMLGDGTIEKKCKRFKIGQAICRKEYIEWAFNLLKPYSLAIKDYNDKHPSTRMRTCAHSMFGELRNKWYSDRKIVSEDLKLNAEIFAHWYLQDGSNNQKKKSVRISTNAFTVNEVEFLIERLKQDLGIIASINFQKGQPIISIGVNEYLKTIDMVRPYVGFECFQYKIDTSKFKVNSGSTGVSKLNMHKAEQIRHLFKMNATVNELADLYQVHVKSIYNVINNVTYRINTDCAQVNIEYNPVMKKFN